MLPVGGEDGTLSRTPVLHSEAHAIHAKTGTLNRAHRPLRLCREQDPRLAGVFDPGERFRRVPAAEIQAWIDKIALALMMILAVE